MKTRSFTLLTFVIIALLSCTKNDGPKPRTEELGIEEQIRKDYREVYLASATPTINWNGQTSTCDPGTTEPAVRNKVLKRINYFRKLCGVAPLKGFRDDWNNACQHAALIMERNERLSHHPVSSWKCYTAEGALAASSSNLSCTPGATAITDFIRDAGATNISVGHRRWVLHPAASESGFGTTQNYAALWAHDRSASYDASAYVAWPPKAVPAPLVFPRWSFSLDRADFRNTKVEMTDPDGYRINCNVLARNGDYGFPAVVWEPESFYDYSHGTFDVSLIDVVVDGKNRTFNYQVNIIPVD